MCPPGYVKQGGTCYRCRPFSDGGSIACIAGDAAIPDADVAPEEEGGSAPEMDSGERDPRDAAPDAASEEASVGDAGTDARSGDTEMTDGCAADTSSACRAADPCLPNPCQNGGSCTTTADGGACGCAGNFGGRRCELEICGDTTIRTVADIAANASCGEIRGNLTLLGGAAHIGSTELPHLTKITGNLSVTTFGAQPPFVESLSLDALHTVEGSVLLASSTALRVVSLPALTTIGKPEGSARLQVQQVAVGRLEMPALTTIHGAVTFSQARGLCSVNLRRLADVHGDVIMQELPWAPYAQLSVVRNAASGSNSIVNVGCCTVVDAIGCETWAEVGSCDAIVCP